MVLAGLLILGGVAANAQGFVVKLGYNYANVSIDKSVTVSDMKAGRSGWQAGIGYQSEVSSGFSFQPEIVYKVSGYKLSDATDLRLGYLEIPVNVQWGPDLVVARPFIFAGPYVGIKLTNSLKGSESQLSEEVIKHLKKAEFGLGVGLGVNVFKFQIAAKYNWNFGPIADAASADYTTLQGKPRTFEISVGFIF